MRSPRPSAARNSRKASAVVAKPPGTRMPAAAGRRSSRPARRSCRRPARGRPCADLSATLRRIALVFYRSMSAAPHRVLRLRRHRHHGADARPQPAHAVRGRRVRPGHAALRRHRPRRPRSASRASPREARQRPADRVLDAGQQRRARGGAAGQRAVHRLLRDASSIRSKRAWACKSSHTIGRSHSAMDKKEYQQRIEAINFSMAHDDGASHRELGQADVILVGVSRSGKTPTSLYLALQFGVKAANYPLIPEDFDARQAARGAARAEGPALRPDHRPRAAARDPPGAPARQPATPTSTTAASRSSEAESDDAPRGHPLHQLDHASRSRRSPPPSCASSAHPAAGLLSEASR